MGWLQAIGKFTKNKNINVALMLAGIRIVKLLRSPVQARFQQFIETKATIGMGRLLPS